MAALTTQEIIINSELDVLKARVAGKKIAAEVDFGEIGLAEIEIVISELGTNIVKHANAKGKMVFKTLTDGNVRGIEITAQDEGPGIKDIDEMMKDGRTTTGTLGIGLSGVKRLTDEFDLQSAEGNATIIRIRKWMKSDYRSQIRCSVLSKPKFGEKISGDAYFFKHLPSVAVFSVIDALGHGFYAHEVAMQAVSVLENSYQKPLSEMAERCHQKLRNTRGCAAAFGRIDFKTFKFQHISVGNVETRVYGTPTSIRPSCTNGIFGAVIENIRAEEYAYHKGACIVMFSDGISGKFELDTAMLRKTPDEISNFIFGNYAKNHDDATVLVLK
jgi:anti-sigma regulatory factor (Ser/Thr protein kinase)